MFYLLIRTIAWPLKALYFRIEAEGLAHFPRRGPAIVVANHASYLDAGVLGSVLPRQVHFMVLQAMYAMWRIRWFYAGMGTIPVQRDRPDPAAIRKALEVLGRGGVLGIFPEGGRSPDGRLRPAMLGAALIAARSAAPVVPAGILGAFEAFPRGRRLPRPRPIRVRFGPPFRYGAEPVRRPPREELEAFSARMMGAIAGLKGEEPPAEAVREMREEAT